MNIGEVAKRSGLNSKTVRYYEDIGLVQASSRSANGYRQYSQHDLEQLQFIQRARKTGFNLDECRHLLSLLNNQDRQSHEVKTLVMEKVNIVEQQIEELTLMRQCLIDLAKQCQSNEGTECAILDKLSEPQTPITAGENIQ